MTIKTERRFEDEVAVNSGSADRRFNLHRPSRGGAGQWRCPTCGSTNLKKVALVYEQGLSHTIARSRSIGFVLGDVAIGRTVTRAKHESGLSMRLRPPVKWSYGKLLLWTGIVAVISLIFYIHIVMSSSSGVSGFPVVVFGVIGLGVLLVLVLLVGRHNLLVYPRLRAEWDRSFVCQRCGAVSRQDLPGISPEIV